MSKTDTKQIVINTVDPGYSDSIFVNSPTCKNVFLTPRSVSTVLQQS